MIIGSENDELYPIYLYTQPSSYVNSLTKEKIDFQAGLVNLKVHSTTCNDMLL